MAKQKSNLVATIIGALVALGLIGAGIVYWVIFSSNINTKGEKLAVTIPDSCKSVDGVTHILEKSGCLKYTSTFRLVSKLKRYEGHVKPGYYEIADGTSNFNLVRMLAAGRQSPIKLTFNNIRTQQELAGRLSSVLEMDSLTALNMLMDNKSLKKYGVDSLTVLALFIPNTYEMYWNEKPEALMDRMKKEYDKFWNDNRKSKLAATGLSQLEVSILASIVEEEQNVRLDEQPAIAGLYINRQRKGMKLESDPTVKFALQDFTIKRVLNWMLTKDSPYNTYKYAGLPPGPIRIPSIHALDAVLNFKKSNYIYMCAKEDLSGYHNFAVTEAEHKANAIKYQHKLNELHIK